MVNILAIVVIYLVFCAGCANKYLMQNCEHLKGDYYACEKAN